MVINKESWHYKLYRNSYLSVLDVPTMTTLCQYARRVLLMAVARLILRPMIFVVWFPLFVFTSPLSLMFGYYPTKSTFLGPYQHKHEYEHEDEDFKKYPALNVAGLKLYPCHALLVLGGWLFCYNFPYVALGIAAIMAVFCGTLWLLYRIIRFSKTETGHLMVAYVKAKKEKICPIVKFDNKPTNLG